MSTPTIHRDATVRQLASQGMSQRAIARQVGIHHNTVARILATTTEPDTQPSARATTEPPGEPEHATHTPPTPPAANRGDILVIPMDEPLRQALAVLRSTRGGADTVQQNAAAARAAIRAMADTILATRQPASAT